MAGEEGKEQLKRLRNIYNNGCFRTFKGVLFPIYVHKLPPVPLKPPPTKPPSDNGETRQGNEEETRIDSKNGNGSRLGEQRPPDSSKQDDSKKPAKYPDSCVAKERRKRKKN